MKIKVIIMNEEIEYDFKPVKGNKHIYEVYIQPSSIESVSPCIDAETMEEDKNRCFIRTFTGSVYMVNEGFKSFLNRLNKYLAKNVCMN